PHAEPEAHRVAQDHDPPSPRLRLVIAVSGAVDAVADVAITLGDQDGAAGAHLEAGARRDDVVIERAGAAASPVPDPYGDLAEDRQEEESQGEPAGGAGP